MGKCLDWAIREIEKRNFKVVDHIVDQHGIPFGATIEFIPSGRQCRLLTANSPVLSKQGYTKSLDAEVIHQVIKNDELLILGIKQENKFYYTTGENLREYFDYKTDNEWNTECLDLDECFKYAPPLCPICKKPLDKFEHAHPEPVQSTSLIEVYNSRIKYCNVPLREVDFQSSDITCRQKPSQLERAFERECKAHNLFLIRVAELKSCVSIKSIYGFIPDFIRGKWVIEVDATTKHRTIEERKRLCKERGYTFYSVRKSIIDYKNGKKQPLIDDIKMIKSLMDSSLDTWIYNSRSKGETSLQSRKQTS